MNFKHTGVFPEQAANWDFAMEKIRNAGRPISVLNLFAYTGGATIACAAAGASVCHVDAAKGMVAWAKENARSSGLEEKPIRWIVDDCSKFVEREIRRGRRYDAIIMDPPSYGRGPSGEIWKLEDNLYPFVELVSKVLERRSALCDHQFLHHGACTLGAGLHFRYAGIQTIRRQNALRRAGPPGDKYWACPSVRQHRPVDEGLSMENAIEIRHLAYSYPDDTSTEHVVFQDLSLDIEQGSFVAVLGHNGCGKSTLAKHLNAILLPEGGTVTVYGLDTKQEENLSCHPPAGGHGVPEPG